jgi:hypothetical protein
MEIYVARSYIYAGTEIWCCRFCDSSFAIQIQCFTPTQPPWGRTKLVKVYHLRYIGLSGYLTVILENLPQTPSLTKT